MNGMLSPDYVFTVLVGMFIKQQTYLSTEEGNDSFLDAKVISFANISDIYRIMCICY